MSSLIWLAVLVALVHGNGHFGDFSSWPDPRRRLDGQPWPKPVSIQFQSGYKSIGNDLAITQPQAEVCDILVEAAKRYRPRLLLTNNTEKGQFEEVVLLVDRLECSFVVPAEMDESYGIGHDEYRIFIVAKQIWGLLRGLETLSQLAIVDKQGQTLIPNVRINDAPRFPHRGVLLDTSRHFLSTSILKSTIDLMSQNKFNVFHWHIIDSQSFPYKSKAYPTLIRGAYAPDHIYSIEDIKRMLAFEESLPEFDTPGHMGGWDYGIPGLLSKCYDKKGREIGERNLIDVSRKAIWKFLDTLFAEVFAIFPDSHFHLGGDEVNAWAENCWLNNKNVQKFMNSHNFTNYTEVSNFYLTHLVSLLNSTIPKKKFILWDDASKDGIPGTIVQIWSNASTERLQHVTAIGRQALLSSCWYLDYVNLTDWQQFYKCDPQVRSLKAKSLQNFSGSAAQKELVLGGEAALWGEWVDESNLLARLFPRASAVAEKLWSPAGDTSDDPMKEYPRLYGWACRMVQRGFPVQPVNGPGFCPKEYHANAPLK